MNIDELNVNADLFILTLSMGSKSASQTSDSFSSICKPLPYNRANKLKRKSAERCSCSSQSAVFKEKNSTDFQQLQQRPRHKVISCANLLQHDGGTLNDIILTHIISCQHYQSINQSSEYNLNMC